MKCSRKEKKISYLHLFSQESIKNKSNLQKNKNYTKTDIQTLAKNNSCRDTLFQLLYARLLKCYVLYSIIHYCITFICLLYAFI